MKSWKLSERLVVHKDRFLKQIHPADMSLVPLKKLSFNHFVYKNIIFCDITVTCFKCFHWHVVYYSEHEKRQKRKNLAKTKCHETSILFIHKSSFWYKLIVFLLFLPFEISEYACFIYLIYCKIKLKFLDSS